MIKPKCDKCGKELKAYGGLAFSPPETLPDESPSRQVDKIHICVECWGKFLAWLKQAEKFPASKSAKNAKTAGKGGCNNFFCRAGRAHDAESQAKKGAGKRRRPLKTTMRVQLGANLHGPSDPKLKTVEQRRESPMDTL